MNFTELDIKDEYRSNDCSNLGKFFISKVLAHSVTYKRAVGFFSSSALLNISKGISYMLDKKGCHIYLVVSPHLDKDDVEAIKQGYKNRVEVIENALLREFYSPTDEFESERLNFLCHLIEEGILDIKVADKKDSNDEFDCGMYHEKIGLFIDENGNKIAFTGSLNESENAYANNFESVQVFKSWEEPKRVVIIENDFDHLWDDNTDSLVVYEFPEAVKKALFRYRKPTYHKDIDNYEQKEKARRALPDNKPKCNYPFELYEYQKNALNKWANQNFRGLFDMGTGTGKTITALTGAVKLLERLNYRMATIIVCPYTHLVEQWVEEEENFNIKFIVGYSDPKYGNYESKLSQAIQDFNDGIIKYFFFITTNASFKLDRIQNLLKNIKSNVLFIADEVHNMGAEKLQQSLIHSYKYRMGLSATIERNQDEEGTQAIYDYFGTPVIHYGLKDALYDGVLTNYYYFPIPVFLTDDERDKYLELSKKIGKNTYSKDGKAMLTKEGERLAIARARIVATAQNKIPVLKSIMEDFKTDHNLLVYCGTGKISGGLLDEEAKQIDEVCKMLGNDLGMKIARYTSRENTEERSQIKERYINGDDLQAIVAIKCLDEGVNIPSIKTAFILASSTNPREYIQRRGRVLRKFKGKDYSYIYDFVTLPFSFEDARMCSNDLLGSFKSLAQNEINRIKEFSDLAKPNPKNNELIQKITDTYGLNDFSLVNEFDYINWEDIYYGD